MPRKPTFPFGLPTRACLLLALALSAVPYLPAGNTWTGGGGSDNWSDNDNWGGTAPGYGTLIFSGTNRTTNNNNSITSMNQVNWNGAAAWVMNGSTTLSLFDNGGAPPKLESFGTGGVTINANITFAANNGTPPNPFGEINAVNSNINFAAGTLTVNGSSVNGIKFFGGAGQDVTFSSTVNASGKWFATTSANGFSVTIASGASVTMGDFYLMNGNTLNLAGGTLSTSAVRLGGDFGNTGNQNQTLGGTLALTPVAGGISFGGTINSVGGNSSGALLIDSRNTSGANTLSGAVFLDSALRIQTATGGALLLQGGSVDVKAQTLTVQGGGTTTINEVLSSSLGAGGSVVKTGPGTLILQGTSNTYTGTNNTTLNASGTQINGGTLGIYGDGSLGLAPAGAYNNIQFTGSGTLQNTANNVSLNANRNISVANGATATLDSNGNNFSVGGVINGTGGNLAIKSTAGAGTVTLTGANTFTGTTTVNSGSLNLNATTGVALAATSGVTVNSGGTLLISKNEQINNAATITLNGGTIQLASGVAENVGALTLQSTSILNLATGSAATVAVFTGGTFTAGTLEIRNWHGTAASGLVIGSAATPDVVQIPGFSIGQVIPAIRFFDDAGTDVGAGQVLDAAGTIVPVPEPATLLVGALALLAVAATRRRGNVAARRGKARACESGRTSGTAFSR